MANVKLVEPDWKTSHHYTDTTLYQDVIGGTIAKLSLAQPLYLDSLASSELDQYYDLKIVAKDNYAIMAHKMVLGCSSRFIRSTFDDQMPGEITTLLLPEISIEHVQRLLELAYNGETVIKREQLVEFNVVLQQTGFIRIKFMLPNSKDIIEELVYEGKLSTIKLFNPLMTQAQAQAPCGSPNITKGNQTVKVPENTVNDASGANPAPPASKPPSSAPSDEAEFVIVSSDSDEDASTDDEVISPKRRRVMSNSPKSSPTKKSTGVTKNISPVKRNPATAPPITPKPRMTANHDKDSNKTTNGNGVSKPSEDSQTTSRQTPSNKRDNEVKVLNNNHNLGEIKRPEREKVAETNRVISKLDSPMNLKEPEIIDLEDEVDKPHFNQQHNQNTPTDSRCSTTKGSGLSRKSSSAYANKNHGGQSSIQRKTSEKGGEKSTPGWTNCDNKGGNVKTAENNSMDLT